MTMRYEYTGEGFIPGVPARDISEDEAHLYSEIIDQYDTPPYVEISVEKGELPELEEDELEEEDS